MSLLQAGLRRTCGHELDVALHQALVEHDGLDLARRRHDVDVDAHRLVLQRRHLERVVVRAVPNQQPGPAVVHVHMQVLPLPNNSDKRHTTSTAQRHRQS